MIEFDLVMIESNTICAATIQMRRMMMMMMMKRELKKKWL